MEGRDAVVRHGKWPSSFRLKQAPKFTLTIVPRKRERENKREVIQRRPTRVEGSGSCSIAEAYNAHAAAGSPIQMRHPTRIAFKDILRQGTFTHPPFLISQDGSAKRDGSAKNQQPTQNSQHGTAKIRPREISRQPPTGSVNWCWICYRSCKL